MDFDDDVFYGEDDYDGDDYEGESEVETLTDYEGKKYKRVKDWDTPALSSLTYGPDDIELFRLEYFKKASGISFGLVMKRDDGYHLIVRNDQPCYGELRKYKRRDPEGYTDPKDIDGNSDDYLPSDLFHPFPSGEPVAVFVKAPHYTDGPILDFMMSLESPWRSVTSKMMSSEDGSEFVLLDTDVDPTVLVSFLNNYKTIAGPNASGMLEYGFSPQATIYLSNVLIIQETTTRWHDAEERKKTGRSYSTVKHDVPVISTKTPRLGYYLAVDTDLGRFYRGETNDLSGGTFRDRYDYNRKRLQDVFQGPDGKRQYDAVVKLFSDRLVTDIPSLEDAFWDIVNSTQEKEIAA